MAFSANEYERMRITSDGTLQLTYYNQNTGRGRILFGSSAPAFIEFWGGGWWGQYIISSHVTEYVTAIQELSILDPSIGLSMAAHNSLCTGHILQYGNKDQKNKWLKKLATGLLLNNIG